MQHCKRFIRLRKLLQVADAVVRIFRHDRSRERSWHFLDSIVPRFVEAISDHSLEAPSTCFYIAALGKIARVAEVRIEDHVEPILGALVQRWDEGLEPSNCIVEAISDLSNALRGGFQRYLPLVIPKVCGALLTSGCSEATITASLRFLQETATLLRDWIHTVIPALLATAERASMPGQMSIMDTLLALSCSSHIIPHLSRIFAVLYRLYLSPRLSEKAHQTMCYIAKESGRDANTFIQGFERHSGVVIAGHRYYVEYIEGTGAAVEARCVTLLGPSA